MVHNSFFNFAFQVAVLDISSSSVLFLTDSVSDSSSPVISLGVKLFPNTNNSTNSLKDSNLDTLENPTKNVVFFMTKDGHIVVCDSTTGKILASQSLHLKESSAISMYILGESFCFKENKLSIMPWNCNFLLYLCRG